MKEILLSRLEISALESAASGDVSDPVGLMRQAGVDISTFFEFGDWTGVDFRKSDLTGVSLKGSELKRAILRKDQALALGDTCDWSDAYVIDSDAGLLHENARSIGEEAHRLPEFETAVDKAESRGNLNKISELLNFGFDHHFQSISISCVWIFKDLGIPGKASSMYSKAIRSMHARAESCVNFRRELQAIANEKKYDGPIYFDGMRLLGQFFILLNEVKSVDDMNKVIDAHNNQVSVDLQSRGFLSERESMKAKFSEIRRARILEVIAEQNAPALNATDIAHFLRNSGSHSTILRTVDVAINLELLTTVLSPTSGQKHYLPTKRFLELCARAENAAVQVG